MRKLKKWMTIPAAAVIAGCLLTGFASAASVGTVSVATTLNVRSAGNTGAPIIGRLNNGATVTILGTDNGWMKISYNGGTAWVSGLYIKTAQSKAQQAVDLAKNMIGVKYVFGGATPSGFDCSGLTMYVYGKAGVTLTHSAAVQATQGVAVSRSNLQPGDLIFFDTDGGNNAINHVGIYIGGGSFISAQSGAGEVKEASLSNSFWSAAYMSARRVA